MFCPYILCKLIDRITSWGMLAINKQVAETSKDPLSADIRYKVTVCRCLRNISQTLLCKFWNVFLFDKNQCISWLKSPLPWASVHWLVQRTLECHCNAIGWPCVHCDNTGWPSEYLQGYTGAPLEKLCWNCPTLEWHWRFSDYCSVHWNTTGGTIREHAHPGTYS